MWNGRRASEELFTSRLGAGTLRAEAQELLEARNVPELKEEFGDVWVVAAALLWRRLGLNSPVLGPGATSAQKWADRIDLWKSAFKRAGFPFEAEALRGGSNYTKAAKRRAALEVVLGRPPSAEEEASLEAAFEELAGA